MLLGTLCFATAVVALHYIAIWNTRFFEVPLPDFTLRLGNEALAMVVTLAAFVICGAFLLAGATFFPEPAEAAPLPPPHQPPPAPPAPEPAEPPAPSASPTSAKGAPSSPNPPPSRPSAPKATTRSSTAGAEKVFCPWSISEAEKRLEGTAFVRVHRSYLVNPPS